MRIVAVLVCALALAASSEGATIHVPSQAPTIQAGINAAVPGDTVLVAPGTYVGAGNRDLDFGGKVLVLRSSGGAAMTVVDCQRAGRGFTFHSSETPAAVVEGFTIRNGLAALDFGGAVSVSGASPTIRNCVFDGNRANTGRALFLSGFSGTISGCTFTGNTADNWGGAIYGENTPLTLVDCTLNTNTAGQGGGLYLWSSSFAALTRTTFVGNTAPNRGGGVYCDGGTLTVAGCTLSGNTAGRGGGMYCPGGVSASLDSCTLSQNSAQVLGGGIFGLEMQGLTLTGCRFLDNVTEESSYYYNGGGAVFLESSAPLSASDSEFTRNRALGGENANGGAIPIFPPSPSSGHTFTRCMFVDNSAADWGGALYLPMGALFRDCTLTDNEAGGPGGAVFKLGSLVSFVRCNLSRNQSGEDGGAVRSSESLTVTDCMISENSAVLSGGAIFQIDSSFASLSLDGCTLARNSAASGGAILLMSLTASLSYCVFSENSAVEGAAVRITGQTGRPITFSRCTFARNAGSFGSAVSLRVPITIENSVLAFGAEGEAVRCVGSAVPVLSCTDIFGNDGGDWTACIADQLGINGCFAADPLFCGPLAGDYRLAEGSPCAPAHSPGGCGQIGALGVGCVTPIGVGYEAAAAPVARLRVFPNPVAHGAVIEWASEGRGPVALRLYGLAGRLVRALDVGPAAGARRKAWVDLAGSRAPAAGVYFLRLEGIGAGTKDARVVVVR